MLGLCFRPNVKEDTLSTTYLLHDALLKSGFEVLVHDVEFSQDELIAKGLKAAASVYDNNIEVAFLVTMHKEYDQLDFARLARNGLKFFVDGRNNIDRTKVENAGIEYMGIGH